MTDQEILVYLRDYLKHLYDLEMAIRSVETTTKYGDIAITVNVQNGVVFSWTIIPSFSTRYLNPKKVDKSAQMV